MTVETTWSVTASKPYNSLSILQVGITEPDKATLADYGLPGRINHMNNQSS
jgi:hypothetical protein